MDIRQIIYRGKSTDDNQWVVGWYCEACYGSWPLVPSIIPMEDARAGYYHPVKIDTATICQYTGVTDKNKRQIFDGDFLLREFSDGSTWIGVVDYEQGAFVVRNGDVSCPLDDRFVVIGNVYDNSVITEAS